MADTPRRNRQAEVQVSETVPAAKSSDDRGKTPRTRGGLNGRARDTEGSE